jgi:hypothetical protein
VWLATALSNVSRLRRKDGVRTNSARATGNLCPMHSPSAAIGPVKLEDLFREIDTENVDFHDEPPHVRLTSVSVSRRVASGPSQ